MIKPIFPKKHPWFHIKLDTAPQTTPSLSRLYNSKTDIYLSNIEAFTFLLDHQEALLVPIKECIHEDKDSLQDRQLEQSSRLEDPSKGNIVS